MAYWSSMTSPTTCSASAGSELPELGPGWCAVALMAFSRHPGPARLIFTLPFSQSHFSHPEHLDSASPSFFVPGQRGLDER
jgi:hypothetical protein